jgi:hypothetical protein
MAFGLKRICHQHRRYCKKAEQCQLIPHSPGYCERQLTFGEFISASFRFWPAAPIRGPISSKHPASAPPCMRLQQLRIP